MQRRQCMQSGFRNIPSFASPGGKNPKGQALAHSLHFTQLSATRMPLFNGHIILYIFPIGQTEHQKERLKTSHPMRPTVVVMAIMMYISIPHARNDVGRSKSARPANITIITAMDAFLARSPAGTLRPVSGSSE